MPRSFARSTVVPPRCLQNGLPSQTRGGGEIAVPSLPCTRMPGACWTPTMRQVLLRARATARLVPGIPQQLQLSGKQIVKELWLVSSGSSGAYWVPSFIYECANADSRVWPRYIRIGATSQNAHGI